MPDPQTLPALVRAKYPGQYDDLSDADLDAKVRAKFPGVYDDIPKPSAAAAPPRDARDASAGHPGTTSGLTIAALSKAAPMAANEAVRFATSPTAAKVGGAISRGGTTIAGIAHGLATGNIPEVIASPIAGWQAGKGGYWLTKGAQSIAAPIAKALDTAAPLLAKTSVVQGGLDLAQMAEPNRRDIGVMGVGPSAPRIDPDALLASQAATLDRLKVPAAQKAAALQRTKADLIRLGYYK